MRTSENRVARLMQCHGIKARIAIHRYTLPTLKRFFGNLPNQQHEHPAASPNQVWVGDITYLKVGNVYRNLAVVLDRCSRMVIGWSYGRRKDIALTLRALIRAVANRRPGRGLIFHSDRGIEYAAHAYRARLRNLRGWFPQQPVRRSPLPVTLNVRFSISPSSALGRESPLCPIYANDRNGR